MESLEETFSKGMGKKQERKVSKGRFRKRFGKAAASRIVEHCPQKQLPETQDSCMIGAESMRLFMTMECSYGAHSIVEKHRK